jgi:hypothetical protein
VAMSCLTIQPEPKACPYRGVNPESCQASVGAASSARRMDIARCTSPDHDDCPTFLAKLLRSLRPHPFVGDRDLWSK